MCKSVRVAARLAHLAAAFACVVAAVVPPVGCSRQPAVTGAVASAVDPADSSPNDADGGAGQATATAGPVDVPADATADTASAMADGADASADADVVGDAAVALPSLCTAELPAPGDVCAMPGAVSCTNIGAHTGTKRNKLNWCKRPNAVRCSKSSDGKLTWVLEQCATAQAWAPCVGKPADVACLSIDGLDQCHPVYFGSSKPWEPGKFFLDGKPVGIGGAEACPEKPGWTQCAGSYVQSCTTLANTGAYAGPLKAYFGECGKYLEKGYWKLPTAACYQYLECPCKVFLPPPQSCNLVFYAKCAYDPNGKPWCQKDCKDVGAPGY